MLVFPGRTSFSTTLPDPSFLSETHHDCVHDNHDDLAVTCATFHTLRVNVCPLQRLWTEHAGELKVPNVLSSSSFAHSSLSRAELSVCTQYIVLYIYCMSMWRNNTPFFSSLLSQSTARAFVFSSAWRLSFPAAKLKKWWWHSHWHLCDIWKTAIRRYYSVIL